MERLYRCRFLSGTAFKLSCVWWGIYFLSLPKWWSRVSAKCLLDPCQSFILKKYSNAFALIRYGMNITLTEEEVKSVSSLCYLAVFAAIFVNDYFSYEKDEHALLYGSDLSFRRNAVTVLAREHSITVDGAKQVLAERILAAEEEFRQGKGAFEASQPPISKELQRYLSGIEMLISGNLLWHSSSPRYHKLHFTPVTCPVDLTTLTASQPDKTDLKITKETSRETGSNMQNIYLGFNVIDPDDEVCWNSKISG